MKDPLEDDEGERDRRADEELRELRWIAFVEVVLSFAESESWPDVLHAVARAMRERGHEYPR